MHSSWTPANIAWVAGIIEGEGHIPKPDTKINIVVNMTDEDVIRKLLSVTGLGSVTGPLIKPPPNKPIYKWKVSKAEEVYAICAAIYQFMGQRRGGRIIEVLEWYARWPRSLILTHGTATRYKRMKCRCDPCKKAFSIAMKEYKRRKQSQYTG